MTDYEWLYYIGGDCGFRDIKQNHVIARINHIVQGTYEALLVRREDDWPRSIKGYFPLGRFDNPESAQEVIESVVYDGYYKKLNEQHYKELENA